jgi:hypothetical protein
MPSPVPKPRWRWRRWLLLVVVLLGVILFLMSLASHEVETSIDLQATPREAWAVLTDFPAYATWNPYLKEVQGRAEVGQPLTLKFFFPGQEPRVLQLTVQEAMPGQELRLQGSWWLVRLLDGEEYYLLETQGLPPGTVRLRHGVRVSGLLVPWVRQDMERYVRRGLEEMNEAFKKRVEARRGR